jgi:hypothetical protein
VDKLKLETSLLLTAGIEKTDCIKLTSSTVEMGKKKAKVGGHCVTLLMMPSFLGLHKGGSEWNNGISIEFPFVSFGKFGT